MSILSENIGRDLDIRVVAYDKVAQAAKLQMPVLVIDPADVVSIAHDDSIVTDPRIATDARPCARFFDLAKATPHDYTRIINAIADGADAVVFWNVDRIPQTPEFNDLVNMVYFALKGEEYGVDFSIIPALAHCHAVPQYLSGHLDGAYLIDTSCLTK